MIYKTALHKTEEGFSVSAPGLPSCWSQGATEPEALESIPVAIRGNRAVPDDIFKVVAVRAVEVMGRAGLYTDRNGGCFREIVCPSL